MHFSPQWLGLPSNPKAVFLLLLIYCLMYLPIFVVVLCLSFFWYAFLCIFLFLDGEERAGCLALIVFLTSCYCTCSVALPHGAVALTAVCDCGIY